MVTGSTSRILRYLETNDTEAARALAFQEYLCSVPNGQVNPMISILPASKAASSLPKYITKRLHAAEATLSSIPA
jgi:hypothetical protein